MLVKKLNVHHQKTAKRYRINNMYTTKEKLLFSIFSLLVNLTQIIFCLRCSFLPTTLLQRRKSVSMMLQCVKSCKESCLICPLHFANVYVYPLFCSFVETTLITMINRRHTIDVEHPSLICCPALLYCYYYEICTSS